MTEQTIGQVLERDHHVIDEHFAAFARSLDAAANGTAADKTGLDVAALTTGVRALKHHIYVEEKFHFPALQTGGLMGPIMVMLREHGELWDLLDRLEVRTSSEAPLAEVSDLWLQVAKLLDAHNMKEEQIIYPGGDQILDIQAAADVRDALDSGETPQGWVCQMATPTATPTMTPKVES